MTLNDEIKNEISSILRPSDILDDWEDIADKLSDEFLWVGSKIDWANTVGHKTIELHGDYTNWVKEVNEFINSYHIDDIILRSSEVYYINDSSLDFSVRLTPRGFLLFLDVAIRKIPQHHYFFDLENKWCLVVSSEGYVDFGFSRNI